MTDIRQALEEAWNVIHPEPDMEDEAWWAWEGNAERFDTFIYAEAWTDAAMMLFLEKWKLRQMSFSAPCADDREWHLNVHGGKIGEHRVVGRGKTPAHALLAACLKAKEQADG